MHSRNNILLALLYKYLETVCTLQYMYIYYFSLFVTSYDISNGESTHFKNLLNSNKIL